MGQEQGTLPRMELETYLWLGSGQSHEQWLYARSQENTPRALAYQKRADDDGEDVPEGTHPLLVCQGNVGVIAIAGTTVDGSAGWMMNYGVVGYDDIRNALVAAIQNPNIGAIMLNVASGGGHVAGVHESAKLIKRVDGIKPVITYTGSNMLSAALWQGVAGRKIIASETAEVGSIGILMVSRENSKMMEQMGITTTVVRAGKYKALANSNEPLSKTGKELLEKNAQAYYDIFMPWVAENRKSPVAVADGKYGQGLTFVGKQALDVGLIDKVGNYEDALAMAQTMAESRMNSSTSRPGAQQKPVYGSTNYALSPVSAGALTASAGHNSPTSQGTLMTLPLTPEALAAMAQGVDLTTDAGKAMLAAAETIIAQAKAGAPAPGTAGAAPALAPAAATPAAPAVAAAAAVPAVDGLTAISGLLAQAQGQNGVLLAQVETLTAQTKAHDEAMKPFVAIARGSVKNMAVALKTGATAESIAAMSDTQVLAEHQRLQALFTSTFKAGGVAAAPGAAETTTEAKADLPLSFLVAAPVRK